MCVSSTPPLLFESLHPQSPRLNLENTQKDNEKEVVSLNERP